MGARVGTIHPGSLSIAHGAANKGLRALERGGLSRGAAMRLGGPRAVPEASGHVGGCSVTPWGVTPGGMTH